MIPPDAHRLTSPVFITNCSSDSLISNAMLPFTVAYVICSDGATLLQTWRWFPWSLCGSAILDLGYPESIGTMFWWKFLPGVKILLDWRRYIQCASFLFPPCPAIRGAAARDSSALLHAESCCTLEQWAGDLYRYYHHRFCAESTCPMDYVNCD